MVLGPLTIGLALASGGLVGLVLGLIGGGGSILAVPLLVYAVGVSPPHVAIGTAALAVALNAATGLAAHARAGTVKWRCALVFALSGIAGTALGAEAGKAMDGGQLVGLFGLVMVAVGVSILRPSARAENPHVRLTWESSPTLLPWLIGIGFGVGLLSGFFGIGGGFLIVPGLMLATAMPMQAAVGTSLVAVTAFGLTAAGSYAVSGLIDWRLAAIVIAGGVAGAFAGASLNARLSRSKRLLTLIFASGVIAAGLGIAGRAFLG